MRTGLLKFIAVFLAFFASIVTARASSGFIPVRNFSLRDYNGGGQNWGVAQDRLGRIYFANRDGLLRFDGIRWSRSSLPNYTTVRSVLVDDDARRIYVGGSGEFGYFEADASSGLEQYHSLTPLLRKNDRNFTEVWRAMRDESGIIWFQSDYSVFRYDGHSCISYPLSGKITSSALIGNPSSLYVALENGSILRFSESRFVALSGCDVLRDRRINGILALEGSLLVCTASNGLFLHNGVSATPFPTKIDDFIVKNQLFCAMCVDDSYIFGTVSGGAVIINFKTGTTDYINRLTGLQNNTVLAMGHDFNKSVWLCLDNGVSVAFTKSPVRNLLASGEEIGAGYASMLLGERLLVGTNQALFSLPWGGEDTDTPPVPIRELNGQVWSIDTLGNRLFVCSDRGFFQGDVAAGAVSLSPMTSIGGAWGMKPLKRHPGYALVSTYSCFHLLKKEVSGQWTDLGPMSGYESVGGKFEEDEDGNIWIGHWLKGIYCLTPDYQKRKFVKTRLFTEKNGLPSVRNNSVVLRHGKILIATESGIYSIKGDRAERNDDLSQAAPKGEAVHLSVLNGNGLMMFSPDRVVEINRNAEGKSITDTTSFRLMSRRLLPGFENVAFADGRMIVGYQDGFYIANSSSGHSAEGEVEWSPKAFVASVKANQDSLIYLATMMEGGHIEKIPYSLNSLRFEFAMPEFRDENGVLFSCFLENYDKSWSTPSAVSSKEYTQLHEGNYILHLRAFNPATGESSESEFSFRVLPPWWRSTVANIVYAVAILVSLFFARKMIRKASSEAARKIEKRKEEEMAKLKERTEQEALRKDYEIAALKSEQLEHDIKHKSSELSNITMNVIRKNEILLDISSRLEKLRLQAGKDSSGSAIGSDIEKIQKLIGHNISHDDDWKNFNQNFDIVYENYTKRLMERHPDLNKTEQRICCYLKMGLSTKEIAPLFNIAPRSVEMSRYRLRKKMGLDRDTNLTAYLQNL